MNPSRGFLQQVFLALACILLPGAASFAQDKSAESIRVVLKGHDPVAYFTAGKPVKGDPSISYDWDGQRYLFASSDNRKKFAADPDRYAPQFGGYCTGTMARGGRAEADPEAWVIADGKLYVFGQVKFKDMAQKDPEYLALRIPKAETNWRAKR